MKTSFHKLLTAGLALLAVWSTACRHEEASETDEPALTDGQTRAEAERFPGPPVFSDAVRFDYGQKDIEQDYLLDTPVYWNFANPETVGFEMTLVPGDAERSIAAFYLSTTEVTAEAFYPWATGAGLVGDQWEHWRSLGLHPSQISRESLALGPPDRPALAMSRTVAEHYCDWLSEQTGRSYRLPTEAEWAHALRLGGGVPAERDVLLQRAVLMENNLELQDPPFIEMPRPVASLAPDSMGLYDFLGNAAEWVTDTGERRVVQGGHYELSADLLTPDWRAVEDLEVWNASAPNLPAEPWYQDFPYSGIRLACDADQAPPAADDTPAGPTPGPADSD